MGNDKIKIDDLTTEEQRLKGWVKWVVIIVLVLGLTIALELMLT